MDGNQKTPTESAELDSAAYPVPASPLPPPHANAVERARAEAARDLFQRLLKQQENRSQLEKSTESTETTESTGIGGLPEQQTGLVLLAQHRLTSPAGSSCDASLTNSGESSSLSPGPAAGEASLHRRGQHPGVGFQCVQDSSGVLDVVYEDGEMLAVNKPCGLYCEDTLAILQLQCRDRLQFCDGHRLYDGLQCCDGLQCRVDMDGRHPCGSKPSDDSLPHPRALSPQAQGGHVSRPPSSGHQGAPPTLGALQQPTAAHNATQRTHRAQHSVGKKGQTGGSKGPFLALVHRLDRDTSGILLVAKTPKALRDLSKEFAEQRVKKAYVALVLANEVPSWSQCTVDTGHGRSRNGLLRVYRKDDVGRVLPGGSRVKSMGTELKVLHTGQLKKTKSGIGTGSLVTSKEVCEEPHANHMRMWLTCKEPHASHMLLLQASPHTGRTHQIRLHCQHLGLPLVGDVKYGGTCVAETLVLKPGKSSSLGSSQIENCEVSCADLGLPVDAHALHASSIELVHPTQKTVLKILAPLPKWGVWEGLGTSP